MPKRKWPSETDLPRLKALAKTFLMLDIQPTRLTPLVVKHPFTDSGIVGIMGANRTIDMVDLINDPKGLQDWREFCRDQIDAVETASELMNRVTKPYKLAFLKYAAPLLSKQDTASLLVGAWISVESPNSDPNLSKRELLSMFRSVGPQALMDEEEYGAFQALDDVVTVYRGVTSYNAKNVKALSWTLRRSTAEWFASRYGGEGTVYEAQIQKEHILALFLGRNEAEVIVDPGHLINLSQCPVNKQMGGFEMAM